MSGAFPAAARDATQDAQLRANVGKAVTTIRARRAQAVAEVPDWQALRDSGAAIKERALLSLAEQLELLEAQVVAAGGTVHWARTGTEANQIVVDLACRHQVDEVVKVKSITTDEIDLAAALAEAGVRPIETDLAEMIVQLAGDRSSHLLVPAVHRNRAEIRALFEHTIAAGRSLDDSSTALAATARSYLRSHLLRARMAVSGANFAVAETGTVCVVESEGNGRFCLTVPEVLVSVVGVEKVIPCFRDLEVMLQLLPRSATGERMNPYTSLWTGVHPDDGPTEFHLILLDNGRTAVLSDDEGRAALRCIRCSACLNVCPVYERTGGHAYDSVYQGPIGAILVPQLEGLQAAESLPWASSLCGACYEACPVKIDIPSILVHLRGRIVRERIPSRDPEKLAMRALGHTFRSRARYERAQRLARAGRGALAHLPLPGLRGWTDTRELPAVAEQSFREWWRERAK